MAEFFNLVADALFRAGNGALNGGINFGDGFVKFANTFFDLAEVVIEFAREFFWNGGVVHAVAKVLRTAPDIFDVETIFLENAFGFWVDQSEVSARKNYRHATQKFFVKHLGLRVVGDFGGATKIGNRGKEKVLDDGAEQGIGTEMFRRGGDAVEPALARLLDGAAGKIAIGGGNDLALPFFHGKKNRALRGDLHLDFVTRAFEILAALEKKSVQFVAMGKGVL